MLLYLKNYDRYRSENQYAVFYGYHHSLYQISEKNIAYRGSSLQISLVWTLDFGLFGFATGGARGVFILLRTRI